jgi:RNA polymerase sigma-70 factor (ECF subfamily)
LDEHLLIEAAKKDLTQFSQLYDLYFERIFRFVYRRTDDETLADDLTSQTFLQAMMHLAAYEYRHISFSAWLYKIAINEIHQYYRKTKATLLFSLDQHLIENLMEEGGSIFREENVQELTKFLEQLPSHEITILQLRFFESKSFKEIAYILDMNESAAKMCTYRALQKLKKHFAQLTGN